MIRTHERVISILYGLDKKVFSAAIGYRNSPLSDRSTIVCRGVPDHIRSDNGKLRDELLQRQAFDTLLEANGALRAVAAAHQHDPATVPWDTGPRRLQAGLVYWRAKP